MFRKDPDLKVVSVASGTKLTYRGSTFLSSSKAVDFVYELKSDGCSVTVGNKAIKTPEIIELTFGGLKPVTAYHVLEDGQIKGTFTTSADGSLVLSGQSDQHVVVISESSPEDPGVRYGDVNQDENVTITDAILIARSLVGTTSLNTDQQQAADVNGDGSVTITDAILIAKKLVGLIDKFPVES